MWFQAKLLSFYSNLCRTYEISQNPPWVETQENPIIDFSLVYVRISTLLVEPVPTVCLSCHGTKYSKRSDFVGRVTLRVASHRQYYRHHHHHHLLMMSSLPRSIIYWRRPLREDWTTLRGRGWGDNLLWSRVMFRSHRNVRKGVSEVIDIMNWMGRSTNTTINNLFGCNIAYVQLSKTWPEMGRMIVVAIKYL